VELLITSFSIHRLLMVTFAYRRSSSSLTKANCSVEVQAVLSLRLIKYRLYLKSIWRDHSWRKLCKPIW